MARGTFLLEVLGDYGIDFGHLHALLLVHHGDGVVEFLLHILLAAQLVPHRSSFININ